MSDIPRQQGEVRHPNRTGGGSGGMGGRTLRSTGGHVDELIEGYALDALETDERELVDRHCRDCADCGRRLAEVARTVGFLAFDVRPSRPSPDVKIRLMTRIAHAQRELVGIPATTWRGRRRSSSATIPASRPMPAAAARPAPVAEPPARGFGSFRVPRRGGWSTALVGAPLVLALALTGAWAMQLRGQVDERGEQVTDLEARLANLGSLIGASANSTAYPLSRGSSDVAARGQLIADPDKGQATLYMQMDDPDPNRTLQVLVYKEGRISMTGDVKFDDDGNGLARLPLDEPLSAYERVAVKAKAITGDGTDPGATDDTGGDVLQRDLRSIGSSEENPEP